MYDKEVRRISKERESLMKENKRLKKTLRDIMELLREVEDETPTASPVPLKEESPTEEEVLAILKELEGSK